MHGAHADQIARGDDRVRDRGARRSLRKGSSGASRPARLRDGPAARLDFTNLAPLTFERPDSGRFPSLRLAREALALGGFAPVVMNAANEVAVAAFLARRIGFLDIARVVENVMVASDDMAGPVDSLQQVQAADREARRRADEALKSHTLTN